ncbi:MAG: hypothetical protein RLZZ41_479, partial [Actinomycetota bacterium]
TGLVDLFPPGADRDLVCRRRESLVHFRCHEFFAA